MARAIRSAAAMLFAAVAGVGAEFMHFEIKQVPVTRLIANLERLVSESPGDVQLRVNLGRVHMMAYALKTARLGVSKEADGPATEFLKENVMPAVKSTNDPAVL